MNVLRARCAAVPGLRTRLEAHPCVVFDPVPSEAAIEFDQGHWARSVRVGGIAGLRGLVELIDNNPLVCADTFSVPDPGSTLALIAFGPLIRAGLIVEKPSLIASFELDEDLIGNYFADFGWDQGVTSHFEDQPIGSVVAMNAFALIDTPAEFADIDALYEEAFGRSFYVRRMEDGDWDIDLVEGKAYAAYRLRVTEGDPHSLLTVQTMADREGKIGAAQLVHAMNVMAGFEESLGVE